MSKVETHPDSPIHMATTDSGHIGQCAGLTIRQHFSSLAMQGILASINNEGKRGKYMINDNHLAAQIIADDAIICADELIARLNLKTDKR